jgi:hypothetical protein
MRRRPFLILLGVAVIDRAVFNTAFAKDFTMNGKNKPDGAADHPYVGMWVTADGHVRHELLPNGRYDEARGTRQSAYQGRYVVTDDHIEYWDDTGFTADGDFIDDVLHHGGMVLHRRR